MQRALQSVVPDGPPRHASQPSEAQPQHIPAEVLPGKAQVPVLEPVEKQALGHDWPVPTQAVQPPPLGGVAVLGKATAMRFRSHVVTLAAPYQIA